MIPHLSAALSNSVCKHRSFLIRWGVLAVCLSLLMAAPCLRARAQAPVHLFSAQEVESTFPATVYYLGRTAPVQFRNAAAIHVGEHGVFFAGLVDSSGYASSVQETYQMYLLLEQPTQFGSATLQPGAYGAGFVGEKAIVMDLGGHRVAESVVQLDEHLTRPRPLQMVQTAQSEMRLYLGRRWCAIRAAEAK